MPSDTQRGQSPGILLAIAIFKLVKGALLAATGLGAFSLLHKDVAATVTRWVELLRVDPDSRMIHGLLTRVFDVTPKQLEAVAAGTLIYSALLLTEGAGLLLRKHWAEYFTVITTAGLIPLELYEMWKHLTAMKTGVLALNIAIVVYLIWRIRSRRQA